MSETRTYAQRQADYRYSHRMYDKIGLTIPKGMKDELKKLAEAEGVSLSRYIVEAVEARSGLNLTLNGEFKGQKQKND